MTTPIKKRSWKSLVIELLVVLAILTVLAVFLLPIFTKTYGKSPQAQCTNNLRQLAVSVMLKAQKDGDIIMSEPTHTSWMQELGGYASNGIAKCPGAEGKASIAKPQYGINALVCGAALGDIADPSSILLLADRTNDGNSIPKSYAIWNFDNDIAPRHHNGFLVACVDGHVQYVSMGNWRGGVTYPLLIAGIQLVVPTGVKQVLPANANAHPQWDDTTGQALFTLSGGKKVTHGINPTGNALKPGRIGGDPGVFMRGNVLRLPDAAVVPPGAQPPKLVIFDYDLQALNTVVKPDPAHAGKFLLQDSHNDPALGDYSAYMEFYVPCTAAGDAPYGDGRDKQTGSAAMGGLYSLFEYANSTGRYNAYNRNIGDKALVIGMDWFGGKAASSNNMKYGLPTNPGGFKVSFGEPKPRFTGNQIELPWGNDQWFHWTVAIVKGKEVLASCSDSNGAVLGGIYSANPNFMTNMKNHGMAVMCNMASGHHDDANLGARVKNMKIYVRH